jgi:LacI family transcriptional regulator
MANRNRLKSRVKHRVPRVLLLIDTAGSYGRGVVEGIGRYALENGPWSIQFEYRALDSQPPVWLAEWQGDGIIARTSNAAQAKALLASNRPLVELFGYPRLENAHVRPDITAESVTAVEHFLNSGLRNFGYFAFGESSWITTHREAYSKELAERGFTCHAYKSPPSRQTMPFWRDEQRRKVLRWIRSLPRQIGIYTPGDLHAVRLLDACHEAKIAVPDEIAILGRGNDPVICETVHPTLSSMDIDSRRVGYEAAKLLARKMANKPVSEPILLAPGYVAARQSSDFAVVEDADVAQALRFIRQYACMKIDVSRVAQEVGLSRRALEIKFQQYLERAPKAEIRRLRIERAKTLLARTEKTIDAIAHKSGFPSTKYFAAAFSREIGETPSAYRKKSRLSRTPGLPEFS